MKQLRVGITASALIADLSADLWSSGINQNIVYLAMLLQRLDCVSEVVIVNCPSNSSPNKIAEYLGIKSVAEQEIVGTLDVVIELGFRGNQDVFSNFRQRGGRLVSYMAGNTLIMNFEALACGLSDRGECLATSGFDAVWITPQHWATNYSYAKITRSPNVAKAPHLWHQKCFVEAAARERNNPFMKRSLRKAWRVGSFDPNVNVVKTFHFPFLVTEQAFRQAPDKIQNLLLFSTERLKDVNHLQSLVASSNLGAAKKVFTEGRHVLAGVLGRHIDVVVTHQWENNLNYLYWDVLYSGHPLVHNADPISHLGYYYPDFDPVTGGEILLEAIGSHESQPIERRHAELEFLWSLSPENPRVQRSYKSLLNALYG